MSRVYCKDCKSIFEFSDLKERFVRDTETNYESRLGFCPFCGSDELVDMVKCEECGEEIAPNEIEDGLCEKCRVKFQILVKELLQKAKTVTAKEYITDYVCGV